MLFIFLVRFYSTAYSFHSISDFSCLSTKQCFLTIGFLLPGRLSRMQNTVIGSLRSSPPLLRASLVGLVLHVVFCAGYFAPHASVPLTSSVSSASWVPPIPEASEADVLQPFIPPEMPWSAAHRGIDIRATANQVVAPHAGEVTFVGVVVDRPVVTIRHPNGLLSSFEPVESDLAVGDAVSRGATIGHISADAQHCEVGCVHWGVRKPDAWHIGSTVRDLYIDPAFLLGWTEPSILWPVHSDPAN